MAVKQKAKIQIRRGTSLGGVPILSDGEFGLVMDADRLLIGNNQKNLEIPLYSTDGGQQTLLTFKVDHPDAVEMTFQDKMRQYLHAADLGVSPAASASQNTICINNALSVASNYDGKRVIYFGPGTYYINSTIVVPGGISLIGAGRSATKIIMTGGTAFNIGGSSQVSEMTIENSGAFPVLTVANNSSAFVDIKGDGAVGSSGIVSTQSGILVNFHFNGVLQRVETGFKFNGGLSNSRIEGILSEFNGTQSTVTSVKIPTGKTMRNCHINLTGYAGLEYDVGIGNNITVKFILADNTTMNFFPEPGRYEYYSTSPDVIIAGSVMAQRGIWSYHETWKSWTSGSQYPLVINLNESWTCTVPLYVKFST